MEQHRRRRICQGKARPSLHPGVLVSAARCSAKFSCKRARLPSGGEWHTPTPLGDAARPSWGGAELILGCWAPPACGPTPWALVRSLQAWGEEEEEAAGMQQRPGTQPVQGRTGISCRERARGEGAAGVCSQDQFQAIWGLQNHAGCPDNQYLPSF